MSKNLRLFQLVTLLIFSIFLPQNNWASNSEILEEGLPLFWWKEGDFINFGDHISHVLVERIVGQKVRFYNKKSPNQTKKLLGTGSIYFFANEGDVVWGSGVNGKRLLRKHYFFNYIDIRSVRGPLTRQFLKDKFNLDAPEIYGDPALLFPYLFPEFKPNPKPENDYLVIVHYLDVDHFPERDSNYILATEPWDVVVRAILNSKFVISTSLHGVVLAEAYGIPARLLRVAEGEPLLKFYDYYLGSGRSGFQYASSVEEALLLGGEPPISCDLEQVYNAFPFEFWPSSEFTKPNFPKKTLNIK